MAYAKRLQIEYKDINDIDTRIEIFQEGYTGAVVYREYASGDVACELAWGDSSSDRLPVVYGSQATLYFDAETDYEFLDFFTSNSRKNKIFVYKNNSLVHVAFGEADTWSEPLSAAPYEVSFTGYDGLGLLSDEDFLDGNKNPYEGEMTPLAILRSILAKTGLDLPLNTAVSLRPAGTIGVVDALTQVLKDVVTYKELSCYEVLEALFQGCRIFQRNGEWWVISNDKWSSATVTCFNYTAAGVYTGLVTFSTVFSNFWFEGEGALDFLPALKQVSVKQDYGYKSNLVENSSFGEMDNGNFDGWEANGTIPKQRVYDSDGNKYVHLPGKESVVAWKDDARTKWLRTESIRVEQTTSVPTLSVGFALMGGSKSAKMFFGLHLTGDSGQHYNLHPVLDAERNIVYEWESTSLLKGIPVSDTVTRIKQWPAADYHVVDAVDIEAYPHSEVPGHFSTKTVSVKDGIPEGGMLRVYLFLADSTRVEIAGSCWRDIKLRFSDENDEELPTEIELLLVNDPANNFVPDDLELPNGDLPGIPNKLTVYNGGFILNDGTGRATDLWEISNLISATYTYSELIARFVASEMKLARQVYKAALADAIPGIAMVFAGNSNKKFVEAGITYNDRMQVIDGRYIELTTFNIDDFTVGRKINYTAPKSSGGSSGGSPAAVIDTDEKVGLMDNGFALVNKTGYLSDDEFEGETDPETGRVILRGKLPNPENFIGNLSAADTTVQKALETIDAMPGAGDITGSGAAGQVAVFSAAKAIAGATRLTIDGDGENIVTQSSSNTTSRQSGIKMKNNGGVEMLHIGHDDAANKNTFRCPLGTPLTVRMGALDTGADVATLTASGLKLENGAAVKEFSTDGTMAGNSDTAIPTEKAIVSYIATVGVQGEPGVDGVDGAPGIQGPQGLQGIPGADGADGAPGIQGIQGVPGVDGADGAPGLQGIQGVPGADGVDGAQGIQGVPGADGADGAQGPQGIQGVPGADGTGLSEYFGSLATNTSVWKSLKLLSAANPSFISMLLVNLTTTADAYFGRAQFLISGTYNGGAPQINYSTIVNSIGAGVTLVPALDGPYIGITVANSSGQTLKFHYLY